MSKKHAAGETDKTRSTLARSTQAALVALAGHIQTLVADESLDGRCAVKLVPHSTRGVDAMPATSRLPHL
jgi:hypothetical protein